MPDTFSILVALVSMFVGSRVFNYLKAKRDLGHLPGLRSLVAPMSPFGAALPTCWLNPGLEWQWRWRNQVYSRAGTETISALPYLFGTPAIYTSSPEVARQVVSTKGQFFKEHDTVLITLLWGPSVFAANGEDWKRHRRIIAPAFSPETYASVWAETSRVFGEMESAEGWITKPVVDIPVVNDYTYKLALILISSCGFGYPLSWEMPKSAPGEMSFAEALAIVSNNHLMRLILPRWSYHLPIQWIRDIETAANKMTEFMRDMISLRRQELASSDGSERRDILTLMIKSSNEEEESKFKMDDSELLGNTFLLLFAGHDTTAKTIDASLAFLALHEDYQEEMYREIMEVMPTEADFAFENSAKLTKVRACFLEASRLFPAGFMMIRDAAEDLVLRNVGPDNDGLLPIKRGTRVVVDMPGIHYNPRVFPDPEAFKPERWYDAHENDISMFSFGSRACIGRRFALTEGMCFLAKLLRSWRVEMLAKEGETKEEWRRRVVQGKVTMNLGVGPVPIRLSRRS
ncbi:hypothetical protein ACG7TL_008537 [Trametes sanguinea]